MLFIPTSNATTAAPFTEVPTAKGRLTNLDNEEFIGFQFNPDGFSYERAINWSPIAWKGSELGGDLDYSGSGPHEFDLNLRFVSDPAAPDIEAEASVATIAHPDYRVDFEAIEQTMRSWATPLDNLRRPARINVALSELRHFNGVITNIAVDIIETWSNGTAREAMLKLEFREWEPILNTQR
jgi:hypothetical protein